MPRLWIKVFVNHTWLAYIYEIGASATNLYVMILRRALCTYISTRGSKGLVAYLLRFQFDHFLGVRVVLLLLLWLG